MSGERGLLDVTLVHLELPVPTGQVEGGEEAVVLQTVKSIVDADQRVRVELGHLVEPSVVDRQSAAAVLLLAHDDWRAPRTVAPTYETFLQKVVAELIGFLSRFPVGPTRRYPDRRLAFVL